MLRRNQPPTHDHQRVGGAQHERPEQDAALHLGAETLGAAVRHHLDRRARLGGALGSLTRYLLSESITRYPSAIFISNIVGVVVAGVVAYRLTTSETLRLVLIPGFAGGLTTFSSVAVIHAEH
ncbi:MAG: hypothetical protein EBT81_12380, partial [Gammaproteobacteria bacterium]|nr:hypothetical protein [Gammaproteobacteria bacterium]